MISSPALAPLRERSLRVASDIGERLLAETEASDAFDVNAERYPTRRLNGTVGFALCFLALARATGDARYEAAMHRQFARAARAEGNEYGLFSGIAGLAAVAHFASALEPRYAAVVRRALNALDSRPTDEERDLLFGSAGICIARHLARDNAHDPVRGQMRAALADRPRPEVLGLAHGTPGLLVAFAMTLDAISSEDAALLRGAMHDVMRAARASRGALVWPRRTDDAPDEPCRSVWCFGTPGVAIALLQAAQSIGEAQIEAFASDALLRIADVAPQELLLAQFGLCHGLMGNALVYYTAARRTGNPRFHEVALRYASETLEAFEGVGPRTTTRGYDGEFYDAIGHLNGIAGIATGLLTIADAFPSDWLAMHGMFL